MKRWCVVGLCSAVVGLAASQAHAEPWIASGATVRGDFDGDGLPELVVSSPEANDREGTVYVIDIAAETVTVLTSQDSGLDPQPEFWDVARLIAYTRKNNEWGIPQSDPRVWERMIETFDDPSSGLGDYKERFEALNVTHLVWNDPAL